MNFDAVICILFHQDFASEARGVKYVLCVVMKSINLYFFVITVRMTGVTGLTSACRELFAFDPKKIYPQKQTIPQGSEGRRFDQL
jgi:hypothetical protein